MLGDQLSARGLVPGGTSPRQGRFADIRPADLALVRPGELNHPLARSHIDCSDGISISARVETVPCPTKAKSVISLDGPQQAICQHRHDRSRARPSCRLSLNFSAFWTNPESRWGRRPTVVRMTRSDDARA